MSTLRLHPVQVAMVVALALTGCSRKATAPATSFSKGGSEITQLVEQAGELSDPPVRVTEVAGPVEDSVTTNGMTWTCVTTRHTLAEAPNDFPNFDPNSETIFPGGALQGGTISSPSPERIIAKRDSGTLIISNISGATISSVTVPEVTQARILSGANSIIAAQPASFPAAFAIGIDRVQSMTELAMKLHANASFFGLFSSSASFDFDGNDKKNRFLVRLNQRFYSLIFERPSSIDAFFDPSVTASDLAPFVGPTNPPVYVSSVTYGRIFYLLIESTDDAQTMEASVNASFLGFGGGGTVKHVSQLANLRVRAFALGGDATAAMDAVRAGAGSLDGFLHALAAGNNIGTAVPLSYVVRSVRSDRVVKNGVAYDYLTHDCTAAAGTKIHFVASPAYLTQSIQNNPYEKGWFGYNPARVDRWLDIAAGNLHTGSAVYQGTFGGAQDSLVRIRPLFIAGAINGHGAVQFSQGTAFGGRGLRKLSFFDFDASPLANHDYTMVFVARYSRTDVPGSTTPDSCGVLLRGASPAVDQAARFGFHGRAAVFGSQNDEPTIGARPRPTVSGFGAVNDFAVYTVVQSAAAGTKIYVNGALVAQDAIRQDRLAGFPGAMLGLIGSTSRGPIRVGPEPETVDLAEALFFDQPLTDGMRAGWESRLARKYGLILLGITSPTMDVTTWVPGQMPSVKRATSTAVYR